MTFEGIRRGPAALLLAAIVCASPCSQATVKELNLTTPRPFGYVIGDVIEHRISLVLEDEFELDPASIPEPGRASRLLALNEAELESEVRGGESRHSIRLRYQIVNAPPSVTGAGTPHLSLRVLGPEGDLPVVIPAWGFTVGPIVTPEERSPGRLPNLRPALPPPPLPTDAHTARVIALGALALALLAPILRDHLAGRRGAPAARHFDRAFRRLRRRAKDSPSTGAAAEALIEVHAAFNATAGRAVFEHDLARFFVEHPRFEPLRASIEAFFAESGRALYGRGRGAPDTDPDLDRLRDLCRACRDVERRG